MSRTNENGDLDLDLALDDDGHNDPAYAPNPSQATPRKRTATSISSLDPCRAADRRAKARERQRRKRERDRANGGPNSKSGVSSFRSAPVSQVINDAGIPTAGPSSSVQQIPGPPEFEQAFPQPPPLPEPTKPLDMDISPEEKARREKVRESARLRQQKHRALVKQRKMAELGLSMNPDGMGGLEEMHYALGPDGQYQPVLPPPLAPPNHDLGDQAYPQGHTGGQTFASTLLLSFSCSPLLKQHLLRTLHMTNEELASLEPVLAATWDQWDHARRMHYAEQAANANSAQNAQNGSPHGVQHQGANSGPTSTSDTAQPPPVFTLPPGLDATTLGNDYRARFHRPLTAPSLFGHNAIQMHGVNGSSVVGEGADGKDAGQARASIDPALATNGLHSGGNIQDAEGSSDGDAEIVDEHIIEMSVGLTASA